MDEQTTGCTDAIVKAEPSVYEQMHRYLYDYHFGRITFLELLAKWREVLGLPSRDKQ
jgi:hypothetical protein